MCTVEVKKMWLVYALLNTTLVKACSLNIFSLQIHLIFMLMSLEMSVQYFCCYKLFNK